MKDLTINVLKLNQNISLFSALVTKTLIRMHLLFRIAYKARISLFKGY